MPSADAEALRRGYEALNRGDLSEVRALLHPDIEWQEGPGGPVGGVQRGRDGFEGFLRTWLESFDHFRIEPERIIDDEDRLIALVRQSGTGRASGVEIEARIAHVWTIEDGRAIRWQSYSNQEEAVASSGRDLNS